MVECFRMLTISNKLVSYMSSSLPFLNCSSRSLSDKHLAVSLQESIDISILRFSTILNSLLACSLTNRPFPFLSHDRLQYGVSIVEVISGEKWKGHARHTRDLVWSGNEARHKSSSCSVRFIGT